MAHRTVNRTEVAFRAIRFVPVTCFHLTLYIANLIVKSSIRTQSSAVVLVGEHAVPLVPVTGLHIARRIADPIANESNIADLFVITEVLQLSGSLTVEQVSPTVAIETTLVTDIVPDHAPHTP